MSDTVAPGNINNIVPATISNIKLKTNSLAGRKDRCCMENERREISIRKKINEKMVLVALRNSVFCPSLKALTPIIRKSSAMVKSPLRNGCLHFERKNRDTPMATDMVRKSNPYISQILRTILASPCHPSSKMTKAMPDRERTKRKASIILTSRFKV